MIDNYVTGSPGAVVTVLSHWTFYSHPSMTVIGPHVGPCPSSNKGLISSLRGRSPASPRPSREGSLCGRASRQEWSECVPRSQALGSPLATLVAGLPVQRGPPGPGSNPAAFPGSLAVPAQSCTMLGSCLLSQSLTPCSATVPSSAQPVQASVPPQALLVH